MFHYREAFGGILIATLAILSAVGTKLFELRRQFRESPLFYVFVFLREKWNDYM